MILKDSELRRSHHYTHLRTNTLVSFRSKPCRRNCQTSHATAVSRLRASPTTRYTHEREGYGRQKPRFEQQRFSRSLGYLRLRGRRLGAARGRPRMSISRWRRSAGIWRPRPRRWGACSARVRAGRTLVGLVTTFKLACYAPSVDFILERKNQRHVTVYDFRK